MPNLHTVAVSDGVLCVHCKACGHRAALDKDRLRIRLISSDLAERVAPVVICRLLPIHGNRGSCWRRHDVLLVSGSLASLSMGGSGSFH